MPPRVTTRVLATTGVVATALLVTSCTGGSAPSPTSSPTTTPRIARVQTLACAAPIGSAATLGELASDPVDGGAMAVLGGGVGGPGLISVPAEKQDGLRFAKVGLAIRTGETFTIAVSDADRGRVGIGWGNTRISPTRMLRVPGCHAPSSDAVWAVYPGGFWVVTPSCVSLTVASEHEARIVRVPVGARCP